MTQIADQLLRVTSDLRDIAAKCGRPPGDIELVAVSKTHPAEKVREAFDAGQVLFGESRVQEARPKIPQLPAKCHWHFIGHLQKNKIRHALPLFELIHSIDSLELARDVDRIAAELGLFPRVLLQVNVAGEGSKFGFSPETLRQQFEDLLELPRLQIEGLMTIPPLSSEAEDSRPFFAALRALRDDVARDFATPLPVLSMGMSGDYGVAIEEGATHVRIGTAIFGSR